MVGTRLQMVAVDRGSRKSTWGHGCQGSPGNSEIMPELWVGTSQAYKETWGCWDPTGGLQRGSGFVGLLQLLTLRSQQNPSLLLLSYFSSPQKWHLLCPRLAFSAWPAQPSHVARPPSLHKVATSVRGIRWVLPPGTFSLLPHLKTAPDMSTNASACLGLLVAGTTSLSPTPFSL